MADLSSFATLALRVDNTQAVTALKETGQATDTLAAKSQKMAVTVEQSRTAWQRAGGDMQKFAQELAQLAQREDVATQSVNRYAQAIQRMRQAAQQSQANAMASMIKAADPFQGANIAQQAEEAVSHIGKLRGAMTSLAMAASGVSGPIGSVASMLGSLAVGGPIMVGVLAGVAALAFAWEKLTSKAREAKKAQEESVQRLLDLGKQQAQGSFGFAAKDLAAAWQQALDATKKIREITSTPGYIYGTDVNGKDVLLDRARAQQQQALQAIAAAQRDTTRVTNEETDKRIAKAKEEAAEAKKAAEERLRILNETAQRISARNNLNPSAIALLGGDSASVARRAAAFAAQNAAASAAIRKERDERFQMLEDVYVEEARLIQKAADERRKALRDIVANSALGLASQIGGGVGLIGSIVQGGMSGAAGGPAGVAVGATAALVSSIISMGRSSREAAEQLTAMKRQLSDTILAMQVAAGEASELKAELRQVAEQAQAARDGLNQAYPQLARYYDALFGTGKLQDEYATQLNEINAAEQARSAQLAQAYALDQQATAGELQARLLRAQGLSAEAAQVELTAQQQKELATAYQNGASDAEIARLKQVQLAEAQAAAAKAARDQQLAQDELNARMADALGATDDQKEALNRAVDKQRELNTALDNGATAADLAKIALVQQAEDTAKAIDKVRGTIDALQGTIDGLQTFRNSLLLSDTFGASDTDKLAEARRQYNEIVAAAKAGDAAAAGRLPAAAQTFLDLSKKVYAVTDKFITDRTQVLADTDAVMQVFKDQQTIAQQQLAKLEEIRKIQSDAYYLMQHPVQAVLLPRTDSGTTPGTGGTGGVFSLPSLSANISASVSVLQAGFTTLSEQLDGVITRLDAQTDVTRQGFEGQAVT